MKKLSIFQILIILLGLICQNCQKEEKILLEPGAYYRNLFDTTTRDIRVSIPRIEFSSVKSNSEAFIVYVSVSDQDGNPLQGFNTHNFNLAYICKNTPDTIDIQNHTFTPENQKRDHIATGNIMDYSGSMSWQDISDMEKAVKQFVRLKQKNDYMQIIKFHSEVNIINEYSNDTLALINAIENYYSGGGLTAYYSAVFAGLQESHNFISMNQNLFPVIIAFTDGWDNNSNVNINQVISQANQMQIPVYTIGYGSVNSQALNLLADDTGGRYFYTPTSQEIQDLYSIVSGQLSNIYSLTTQTVTLSCNDLIIVVEVVYESFHGKHKASVGKQIILN